MYLTYRFTQPKDLKNCFPLMEDRFAFGKGDEARLFSFWRYLLKGRMARSLVMEDRERPADRRIVCFGMVVFITDEFSTEAKAGLPPPLSYQVFQRWLRGSRVILTHKEIARQNSTDGLNLLVLHYNSEEGMSDELTAKWHETFGPFNRGFRLKEMLGDSFNTKHRAFWLNQGFRLVRDYGPKPPKNFPNPMTLLGMFPADTGPLASNFLFNQLFHPPVPRFGFTQGEKDVMELALFGETDEEIGKSLRTSVWTIKKRWQAAYGRVERKDAGVLLSIDGDSKAFPQETPKAKRRRHLLDYLRQHLEEIRPTLPAHRNRGEGGPVRQPVRRSFSGVGKRPSRKARA